MFLRVRIVAPITKINKKKDVTKFTSYFLGIFWLGKAKSTKKIFQRGDLDHFQAKIAKSETTSFQHFSLRNLYAIICFTLDIFKWGQNHV